MSTILSVAGETFLRLRRDRIFLPAILVGIALLALSGLASYWSLEEFYKILYDMGATAYLFTGAFVAIFWGTKMVSDSKQEGSLEVQLASPIGRSSWLLGKFLGLGLGLGLLAILFLIAWQLVYLGWSMGWLKPSELLIFGLLTVAWFILGAMAVCFATMASGAIALFCSVWFFVCGLLSGPVMQALAPDTPESTRRLVEGLAGLWNLHVFNLANYGAGPQILSQTELLSRLAYGFGLIAFFLGTACLVFQKRDIIA